MKFSQFPMNTIRSGLMIIISFILSIISFPLYSQETGKDCNKCHSMNQFSYFEPDLKVLKSFTVSPKEYKASVHGELECVACHKDTQSYPHKENREKVGCNQDCHSTKEGQSYTHSQVFTEFSDSIHNKGKKGKVKIAPPVFPAMG